VSLGKLFRIAPPGVPIRSICCLDALHWLVSIRSSLSGMQPHWRCVKHRIPSEFDLFSSLFFEYKKIGGKRIAPCRHRF